MSKDLKTIKLRITASVPRTLSEAARLAGSRHHVSVEPEHVLLVLISERNSLTTAFHLLQDLGLTDDVVRSAIDRQLQLASIEDDPQVLQRGGRFRPLMGVSICYACEMLDSVVYTANLVYSLIAAVPGPPFDLLRNRLDSSKVHDAIFSSINREPKIWKQEFEQAGGMAWEITPRHLEQIASEMARGFVEIPYT